MADDRNRALATVVGVSFSVGVLAGWLLNTYTRKVWPAQTHCSMYRVVVSKRLAYLTDLLHCRSSSAFRSICERI